jgi:hypothetical protein
MVLPVFAVVVLARLSVFVYSDRGGRAQADTELGQAFRTREESCLEAAAQAKRRVFLISLQLHDFWLVLL